MQATSRSRTSAETATTNGPAAALLVAVGAILVTIWGGAQVASLLGPSHRVLRVSVFYAAPAIVSLVKQPLHPASAWPADGGVTVPGPLLYWASTIAVTVMIAVLIRTVHRVWVSLPIGTSERNVLGVNAKAALATRRDIRPLVIRHPQPGRLLLGKVEGKLVAGEKRVLRQRTTENPTTREQRHTDHQGVHQ